VITAAQGNRTQSPARRFLLDRLAAGEAELPVMEFGWSLAVRTGQRICLLQREEQSP
jgi:hypothetical protein